MVVYLYLLGCGVFAVHLSCGEIPHQRQGNVGGLREAICSALVGGGRGGNVSVVRVVMRGCVKGEG